MYADETGWLVHGQKAWMWLIANEKTTVYFAAESRGGGIARELYGKSQAMCMHDGYAAYSKTLRRTTTCTAGRICCVLPMKKPSWSRQLASRSDAGELARPIISRATGRRL